MMKIFITIISLFVVSCVSGQSFEGNLTYDVQLELSPKLQSITTKEELIKRSDNDELACNKLTITYKGGNYYSATSGGKGSWSVYRKDSNRIYRFAPGNNECEV